MENILEQIAFCVEKGKINQSVSYPPEMKGKPGVDELTVQALELGIPPSDILSKGLIVGMERIGTKFSQGKAFVPEMLMAAKAMSAAMIHLKPYFKSGEIKRKGVFIICTVFGDLHDIGKNLVAMMIEGSGWEVIDLGVDVKSEKLLEIIDQYPGCIVGLSALLTTTMVNMEKMVQDIKAKYPKIEILVGGAPLSADFCKKIGASYYSPDPQGAVKYLSKLKNQEKLSLAQTDDYSGEFPMTTENKL